MLKLCRCHLIPKTTKYLIYCTIKRSFSINENRLFHHQKYISKLAKQNIGAVILLNTLCNYSSYSHTSFSWRTHTCGELNLQNVGETVLICGWLQFQRLTKFATLRDWSGVIQLYFPPEKEDLGKMTSKVALESILQVTGIVAKRPPGQESAKMKTGEIEVCVDEIRILNEAKSQLPFIPRDFHKVKEPLRLQYRYIDLRNVALQTNLRLRSTVVMKVREFFYNHGFVDVETPTLFRRTPGGAQEFVVPTRFPDLFYSLTQSPQQFKQLLMVGGVDRYYQIARCYRDEGARPDRQPEFTQIDVEMSFVNPEGIYSLIEQMLSYCWPSHLPTITTPFQLLDYKDCIEMYGSDKPDTRFDIKDVPDIMKNEVPFFQQALNDSSNFCVKAIVIPQFLTFCNARLQHDFSEIAKSFNKNASLSFVKIDSSLHWISSLNKYIGEETRLQLTQYFGIKPDDVIIIVFGRPSSVYSVCGKLRLECADILEENGVRIRDPKAYNFLWVKDFPLFEETETGKLESTHHPFTAPHPDDIHLIRTNPSNVRGLHYDLVLNGMEIGGGSIRVHDPVLQKFILNDILKEDSRHLTHLIEALESGCPPHGGIALGLDRLIAIMCNAGSIRDVIAFPKSFEGKDLMANAPAKISDYEKNLYNLK